MHLNLKSTCMILFLCLSVTHSAMTSMLQLRSAYPEQACCLEVDAVVHVHASSSRSRDLLANILSTALEYIRSHALYCVCVQQVCRHFFLCL